MFGILERRRGDERILEGGERKIKRYLIIERACFKKMKNEFL